MTLASLIPEDQLEAIMSTQIEVTADNANIFLVTLGSTSDVINIGLDADITEDEFVIPQFSQTVDVGPSSVDVIGAGTGMLVDENTIQLNFEIIFDLGFLGELNSTCEILFTKQ